MIGLAGDGMEDGEPLPGRPGRESCIRRRLRLRHRPGKSWSRPIPSSALESAAAVAAQADIASNLMPRQRKHGSPAEGWAQPASDAAQPESLMPPFPKDDIARGRIVLLPV